MPGCCSFNICTAEGWEEAGLAVYTNDRFHYEIAVMRIMGKRKLIFRRRLGSLWKVENELPWSSDTVVLTIKADKWQYSFGFSGDEKAEPVWFGAGECAMLATEVAGGFTGVLLAMILRVTGCKVEHRSFLTGLITRRWRDAGIMAEQEQQLLGFSLAEAFRNDLLIGAAVNTTNDCKSSIC